ncbi:hypothetical protein RHS03_06978, partial [Rhizoctonia solani]
MGRWSFGAHIGYWRDLGDIASKHADFITSPSSTCPRIPLWIQPSRTSLRRVPHYPAHSRAPREPSNAKGEPDLPIRLHSAPGRPSRRLLISSSSLRTNATYSHPFLSGGHATGSEPPSRLCAPVFPTGVANVTPEVPSPYGIHPGSYSHIVFTLRFLHNIWPFGAPPRNLAPHMPTTPIGISLFCACNVHATRPNGPRQMSVSSLPRAFAHHTIARGGPLSLRVLYASRHPGSSGNAELRAGLPSARI